MKTILVSVGLMLLGLAFLVIGTIFEMGPWLQTILYVLGFCILGAGFWVMSPATNQEEAS